MDYAHGLSHAVNVRISGQGHFTQQPHSPEKSIMAATRFILPETDIPTHWYNVVADLPSAPAPVLGPDGQPIGPDALSAIFTDAIIEQEISSERWIAIPEPVRELYQLWRPTPLVRARRLEAALGTPARIYYKYEGSSPAGSHKLNSAIAQAYYNREAGIRRMTTETGAGQWGSSLAFAGQAFGIDVRVFMVKVSYQQKPPCRTSRRSRHPAGRNTWRVPRKQSSYTYGTDHKTRRTNYFHQERFRKALGKRNHRNHFRYRCRRNHICHYRRRKRTGRSSRKLEQYPLPL
jgi:hypothetical protein